MRIPEDVPDRIRAIFARTTDTLEDRLGIEVLELTAERTVATMPVAGNTQFTGILHGGAHGVLAEALASAASLVHAGPGRSARGIELNASHSRSAGTGLVTATCTAISLGRTLCVHEVVVEDEEGRRLSTVRVTNLLLDDARDR